MTTLLGFSSYILTVNHRLWEMNCRRNQITFVSLDPCVALFSRGMVVWSWRKRRICGFQWKVQEFKPPGPFISVIYTSAVFHPFVSSHTVWENSMMISRKGPWIRHCKPHWRHEWIPNWWLVMTKESSPMMKEHTGNTSCVESIHDYVMIIVGCVPFSRNFIMNDW